MARNHYTEVVRKYDGRVLPKERRLICSIPVYCHTPESKFITRKILEGVKCDFYTIRGYDEKGHPKDEPRYIYFAGEEDRLVDFLFFSYSRFFIRCYDFIGVLFSPHASYDICCSDHPDHQCNDGKGLFLD